MRKANIIIITLSLGCAILFFSLSLHDWLKCHHQINTFVPVDAHVISSKIEKVKIGSGVHSSVYDVPKIKYFYHVDNERYESSRVAIIDPYKTEKWAKSIKKKYRKGIDITAYYDPDNPSYSYLVREYLFSNTHAGFIWAIPPLLLALGFAVASHQRWGENFTPVAADNSNWHQIPNMISICPKVWGFILALGVICIFAIPTFVHYSLVVVSYESSAVLHLLFTIVLIASVIGFLVYYGIIIGFAKEAKVFIDRSKIHLGEVAKYKFVQTCGWISNKINPTLTIKCECLIWTPTKKDRFKGTKQIIYEDILKVYDKDTLGIELTLDDVGEFVLPADQPISTNIKDDNPQKGTPSYYWFLEVNTPIFWKIYYKAKFPIEVSKNYS